LLISEYAFRFVGEVVSAAVGIGEGHRLRAEILPNGLAGLGDLVAHLLGIEPAENLVMDGMSSKVN